MVIKLNSTDKGIKLTDSKGKDLMQVLPKAVKVRIKKQKNQLFKYSYDDIKIQISAHDVISFDIFDTLITRRVSEPEMVFDLVGRYAAKNGIRFKDFRRERVKAQLESGLENANLDEIYDQLVINTKISKEQAEQLKQEELKCEKNVIIPRQDMVSLFFYALKAQKKVYLTTDMYLNRRHIVTLLNACSITGYYDILDSCEYRKLKLEGLFEELKALNPEKSILHIGDSYINDCICAEVAEIDSILIPKGVEIAVKESIIQPERFSDFTDKIMIGSWISLIYNSPFSSLNTRNRNSAGIGTAEIKKIDQYNDEDLNWYNVGYAYIGPIVLSFIRWMMKNASISKYDGILFSSRDGYLLKKVCSLLQERKKIDEGIHFHYFYVSRKAAVAMHADEEAIINMLIDRTAPFYLPDRMLQEVFCMKKDQVKPYNFDVYGDNRYTYVWDQYKDIKDNVQRLRRNFYRYLRKEGIIIGGSYLFYDFVSSGTVQRSLSPIVPFEMDGVYYSFTGERDFNGNIYSRFSKDNQVLNEYYKIMENLMLSPESSLWSYDDNGDVVFCTEERSKKHLGRIEIVHQGVFTFVNQFMNSFELSDVEISDDLTLDLIQEMSERIRKTTVEKELFDDWFMGEVQKKSPRK